MHRNTILSIVCCLVLKQAFAQFNTEGLDKILDKYDQSRDFNGVILIAVKGEVIFERSMGYADFQNEIKLDSNTPMHLASNTKALTNMGIMILAERGLLDYDDKVISHLPQFPYKEITIRHLMTMTSGLKRLYNKDLDKDGFITNAELLEFFSKRKPKLSFTPGAHYQSSVVGYCILAEVIAKTAKTSYIQFMKDAIFEPLQMDETFIVYKENLNRFRAISYNHKNQVEEWWLGSYIGGVGVYTSTRDMLKWDQAFYTDLLVTKETMQRSLEPIQLNNGEHFNMTLAGWRRWKGRDHLIFKNGDWVANNSILWRDTERHLTIIIMNNRQNKITKFDLMDDILPLLGYDL